MTKVSMPWLGINTNMPEVTLPEMYQAPQTETNVQAHKPAPAPLPLDNPAFLGTTGNVLNPSMNTGGGKKPPTSKM